ncbi:MAG: hypothetical protein QW509_04570 [Sulfolobales archaeon]
MNTLCRDMWRYLDEGFESCCNALDNGFPEVLRCGVLGVASNAPKPDEIPSGMRGKEMRQ